jgi:diguanylate cyclase (GGDEF)-like protein
VDHFKRFNDSHGHEMGDRVLKAIGALLMHSTRAQDVPCRFGGEEFVLILPGASLEDTQRKADELRQQIRETALDRSLEPGLTVTISAGVAAYPQSGGQADLILEAADSALYQAKAQGRDRVVAAGSADGTDTDPRN